MGSFIPRQKNSSLVDYPVSLPTAPIHPETDAAAVANSFEKELASLSSHHFTEDAVWRDIFSLTGTLRTFYSATSISAIWNELSKRAQLCSFLIDTKSARIAHLPGGSAWVQTLFTFDSLATPQTHCSGILHLVPDQDGKWRIWVMRTILEQLKGEANVNVMEPVGEKSRLQNGHVDASHFDCVVIGGGQAGLSTAGRLKTLGVGYVVLDKHKEVGDCWKTRYGSTRLHTIREYGHLPFDRTFPSHYQEFLTKDDLAQGYQDWVSKFGINVWLETTALSGTWDAAQKVWTLAIDRAGEERSITCSYIVLAGGPGGQIPVMPSYQNRDVFQGTILHSAEYKTASQWKGKHGVIVGTANTAHDVAEDMAAAGLASTTMIQRSPTYILPVEYYARKIQLMYNSTIPTEAADRLNNTNPFAVSELTTLAGLHFQAEKEPERFEALQPVGFKADPFGNLTYQMYQKFGGHYMDVGACAKIASGLIKVKSDALPVAYTPDGLEFSDGSHLKADVIVFATGFKRNMRYMVEDLFGSEIAEQMGDFWTLDKEGELKGAFKPCGHPALWYHGGTIGQARYFSRFIALQIKAKLIGTPLPLYQKTP